MSVEVRGIRKSFGAFTALDGVSLDLPKGELIALLGPSGCGKTSLLRIIAGLETPDDGSVAISGQDATTKHVLERNVGFVFQHYALFRHMSVFENIAFGLRVKPRASRPNEAEIRSKVDRLLDLIQLKWLADRLPAQLSGGQRQRIALARALAVDPQVLLLDEPFGALDAQVRKELRRWLRRLHDELHISSIFVTHDQEEALEVADRVVLMNKGRIEQIGSPREIYEHPSTPFANSFIGNANAFFGEIDGDMLRIGEHALPHLGTELHDGASVVAFARPHDMEIAPDQPGEPGVPASINRILPGRIASRIELVGETTAADGRPSYFEVDVAPATLAGLGLYTGKRVRLRSSRLRIFNDPASRT